MSDTPTLPARIERTPRGLTLSGDWTLAHARPLAELASALGRIEADADFDCTGLHRLDTCGALILLRLLARRGHADTNEHLQGLRPADAAMLRLLIERRSAPAEPKTRAHGFIALLARMGAALESFWIDTRQLLGFVGLTLVTLAKVLVGRRRLRLTSTVFHMEQTGLDAVPIVALLTFLVGAVVAFLGATVLRDFGASIFTVELVAYSFLREFGVLLTAILLAGRSGSAFTAQIGSMKSREELDAIRALGLDAVELLVLPRLLALLIMLPLLTFIGMMSGLLGGALVGSAALDISPGMFISRLYEMTEIRHFWVGMIKAPVFAFLIAVVGCLEGMKVAGSAESVGRHTTSSVVQSIFLVILFDALFAMFFMELGV
ncbi:ABC transporter permease [uncultured Aquimonas sp.]|uniref:MlaE family ABC transporter permease n=1 Tax=uncultured Aquimonas sp. TaxID=385483 RepID=UPI00086ABE2E|nr:ABC transporter permease [uncultured Aquimonas sp.]ODU46778.1 MAG: ABC transporter permease [Xanthomonadaceae bacterium SCN 69-123]